MRATRVSDAQQSPIANVPFLIARNDDSQALPVTVVESMRAVWEALPAKSPMQSYLWARACAEAFPNIGFRMVTSGKPGVRAIAVFAESQESRGLLPLGAELFEPTEFAYADAAAAEELGESIVGMGVPVLIRDMFTDSVMLDGLRRAAGRRLVTHPSPGHPWLELDDTWLEPESHLNAGRRSDLRRAQRNGAKLGPLHCEIHIPTAETIEPLLHDAFLVESSGWKGRLGSALAIDPKVGTFYSQFSRAACRLGILRIGILRIGDRAAAMQLAVEQEGCFWLFKMGFDESFARLSPGMLLMTESLRSARKRGCGRFEMMGKSEAWNQVWTPQIHDAVSVVLCAPTVRGWVNVVTEVSKGVIKSHLRSRTGNSK